MKSISVKLLSLLLCVATLVSTVAIFSSCKKEETEEKKTVIIEGGKSSYTLIRADKLDKSTLDLIIDFRNEIVKRSGCEILFVTDWVRNEKDIDPNAKEILVGNTNRPETAEVLASLEPNSWAIVEKGSKIVICANNDALLSVAFDWFTDNCINDNDKTVKITEKLVKKEGYGNGLPISIGGISNYQVVYPEGNKTLEYYASLFDRRASISAVVSDDKEETDYEIIIGNTNRADTSDFSGTDEYSITTDGSKVYINAVNEDVLYYAVNYYIEYGLTISDTMVVADATYKKSGSLNNYYTDKWDLNLPYIEEGKIAPVYNTGTGMASDLDEETIIDSYMHLISNVKYSAFENYAEKLESFGFKKIYSSKTDKNDLWGYRLGGAYAYIHYAPLQEYIRVIWDKSSNCEVSDVEYVEEQTGTTTFYQYSDDYVDSKLNFSGSGSNCGMLYIIKLQDNSLILVDGAGLVEKSLQGLADFLYGITGTAKNEPLKIRMWYYTHPDGDHNGLSYKFLDYLKTHGYKMPDIESICFNYPSERANKTVTKTSTSYNMIEYMNKNYPEINYLKLHTGMVFNIGEVKFEMLGSIENIVNFKGAIIENYDTNDTCALARFSFGGKSFLMAGDIGNNVSVEMDHINLYSETFLKSDVLQASHHGYNLITNLNSRCAPEYILISNSHDYMLKVRPSHYNYYNKLTVARNIHYAGNYTTSIAVTNGSIKVTKLPRYDNPTGEVSASVR